MSHSTSGHGSGHGGHSSGPKVSDLIWLVAIVFAVFLLLKDTVLTTRPAYLFSTCQSRSIALSDAFELAPMSEGWMRAATLVIWGDYEISDGAGIGRGFLYVSNDGHLRMGSAEHVIDQVAQRCTYASFRDTNYVMPLRHENFRYGTANGIGDRIAIYTLPNVSVSNIGSLLQNGEISPLSVTDGAVGDTVAFLDVDDSRQYSYWIITEDHTSWYRITRTRGSAACSGDSGSAMLLTSNGNPTSNVIGAISGLLDAVDVGDGRYCGTDAVVVAVN